ncbi:hypothetical protein AgCh_021260 [Apium graveolens]
MFNHIQSEYEPLCPGCEGYTKMKALGKLKDGKLRYPADAQTWKEVDARWPDFSSDPRNLRLDLSSDGFNPFRSYNLDYSCWPILISIYNLPPWLCMKRKYIMLCWLISGPTQLGNDIDVFLQPLINDLKKLWHGKQVYDAYMNEQFLLRGILLWTISDIQPMLQGSSIIESDDDSESESLPETDADEEMMKLCALMVKGITKIAYRKFRKGKKFSRKGASSDKKNFKKSEGRGGKSDRGDNTNVKCYNCGEKGHISPDCKKEKSDKGKALFTKKKSWTYTSDSESEENYALMANADKASAESSSEAAELKPIVIKIKPRLKPVKFVAVKSNSEKSEVRKELTSEKLKQEKTSEVNVGLMTKKQLKHKLKDVKNANKGNRKNILVLDSGCSGHMTGNKALLSDFVEKAGPSVSYGDGNIGKTLGYGNINLRNVIIKEVVLVSGLKHNLLSVSQICDRGYHVDFFEEHCEVVSKSIGKVVLKGYRHGNIYEAKLSTSNDGSAICLMSKASIEESWNWHKKLSHLNFNNINELVKKDLVRGLEKSVFSPDGLCDSFQKAKQRKSSFKSKTGSSILEPYHLLHVDLFGPVNVISIAKTIYAMVIVDEFTRYTWVYFLHTKSETASILIDHVRQLDKLVKDSVKKIRSDNGTEFKNVIMEEFCKNH